MIDVFLSRAVSKTPKFAHISPVLKSFHWLNIEQRIQYKVAFITYKVLQSVNQNNPSYLHGLLNVQSHRTTRSSVIITLQRPSVRSRLKITYRSSTHNAPVLWHSLPKQLRQPSAPPSHASISCLHFMALLLFLLHYLTCPRISFTLNSTLFSLNNPFLLSLVCTISLVGSLAS